ncbi:hypothetical protein KEM52_001579 [Ascosphaera acerosa]|nr:hypothetical protein KEM52_001579 [Ascosphaera acerosa]
MAAVLAITKQKAEAMRLAREQAAAVNEMSKRAKTDPPPYTFEELIGKGAYGRVYRGHHVPTQKVVAIKVMEVDAPDYRAVRDFKDESIKDFVHESRVMQRVKDAGAKNINMIIEAISIHSQLWLVCDYCPGGSVKTLMRATRDRLEERFIVPIARELAIGLKAIHDAGIIHRDVKAGNVLIHEEGRLQICDFGVAGILQSNIDKRRTWIGTPHWMPPEMFSAKNMGMGPAGDGGTGSGPNSGGYGSEVDVWAYGCTLFECSTGAPPNSNLRERMQIGRQLSRAPPRLEGEKFSEQLRSLVSFALNTDPASRPTMADILTHPYILNTEQCYPTSSLRELVRIYYQWSQSGGQRMSLFNPGGAMAAAFPGTNPLDEEDDWNFSTTDNFERRFSLVDFDQISASLSSLGVYDGERQVDSSQPYSPPALPSHSPAMSALPPLAEPFDDSDKPHATSTAPLVTANMTPAQQANFDERVKRGAEAMQGLFDEAKPDYKYVTKKDFVPVQERDTSLANPVDRSSVASTFLELNLGSFDSAHYAAGAAGIPPLSAQLADCDGQTVRPAGRIAGEQDNGNASTSIEIRASVLDPRFSVDNGHEDYAYQQPSGPRPPTMEWKFPTDGMATTSAEAASALNGPSEDDEETFKRADGPRPPTMEWTFPAMAMASEEESTIKPDKGAQSAPRNARPPTMAWRFPDTGTDAATGQAQSPLESGGVGKLGTTPDDHQDQFITARDTRGKDTKDRPPTMAWTFPSMEQMTSDGQNGEGEDDPSATVREIRDSADSSHSPAPPSQQHLTPPTIEYDNDGNSQEDGPDSGPGDTIVASPTVSPDERQWDPITAPAIELGPEAQQHEIDRANETEPSHEGGAEGHRSRRRPTFQSQPLSRSNSQSQSRSRGQHPSQSQSQSRHRQGQHGGHSPSSSSSTSRLRTLPRIETDYPPHRGRGMSVSRSISRPSTATSSDTDPFRFDGPGSPIIIGKEQGLATPPTVPTLDGPGSAIEEGEEEEQADAGWSNQGQWQGQPQGPGGGHSPGQGTAGDIRSLPGHNNLIARRSSRQHLGMLLASSMSAGGDDQQAPSHPPQSWQMPILGSTALRPSATVHASHSAQPSVSSERRMLRSATLPVSMSGGVDSHNGEPGGSSAALRQHAAGSAGGSMTVPPTSSPANLGPSAASSLAANAAAMHSPSLSIQSHEQPRSHLHAPSAAAVQPHSASPSNTQLRTTPQSHAHMQSRQPSTAHAATSPAPPSPIPSSDSSTLTTLHAPSQSQSQSEQPLHAHSQLYSHPHPQPHQQLPIFPAIDLPDPAILGGLEIEGSDELLAAELDRLLTTLVSGLTATQQSLALCRASASPAPDGGGEVSSDHEQTTTYAAW